MTDVVTLLSNALLLSALYALIAVGFTMIYGVGGTLNIAHGANITIGAFTVYYIMSFTGLGVWAGALGALIVPALFSVVVYRFLIKPVEDQPTTVIILSLVVLLLVKQVFLILNGTAPKTIPVLVEGQVEIGGTVLQNNRILVFFLSWALMFALLAFINRTWTGKAILATSMSDRGSELLGIQKERVTLYTWIIAGALAGLAGLFLGSFQSASFDMGLGPLLLSFSIVILGGLGSIRGSIVGAYIIGFLETITVTLIDARLTGLTGLVVLLLVLLIRPQGLFGHGEVA